MIWLYSLDELKKFFEKDVFATKMLGAKIIEAHDDYAKCSFDINENHMNAKGVVMGGAIFTLADFTFAVATNQHEEYYTVSTTSSVSFLTSGVGKTLYAEAIKIRDGRTMCFYDVNIYNENNKPIAKLSFSGPHILK